MYPIIKENLKLMGPPKEVANSGDVIDLICDFISKKVIEEAKPVDPPRSIPPSDVSVIAINQSVSSPPYILSHILLPD